MVSTRECSIGCHRKLVLGAGVTDTRGYPGLPLENGLHRMKVQERGPEIITTVL